MDRVIETAQPCPMCGCEEILLEDVNYDKIFMVRIHCPNCGLAGFKNYFHTAKDPIERTIEYWNTRAEIKEE